MENKFKDIFKQLRIEKNIGQIELVQNLNVSKGIISLWENGLREPSMSNIVIIANFFDISIDYLVGLEK